MFTIRFLALLVLALGLSSPALGAKQLNAVEQVGGGGDNGQAESTFLACDRVEGCFDGNGDKCSDNPDARCNVALVPEGRCTRGTGPCVWPQGAGACTDDGSNPHAPLVPCLPDDPGQRGQTSGTFASTLCPGAGLCDMSTNDPSCECQGDDPNQPNWEGVVCSLSPNFERYLYCSDGGKVGDQVVDQQPGVTIGGFGTALCTNISLVGTEAGASFSNCGYASNFPGIVDTPLYAVENRQLIFTAQRKPGTGLARPLWPAKRTRLTAVAEVDEVGTGDFAAWGIRKSANQSESYFADAAYVSGQTVDSGLDNTIMTFQCDPPAGWANHQPIRGTCTDGVTACIADAQCPTTFTCDPTTFVYCNEFPRNPQSFIFTRDITTTELVAAGKVGVCPPDCGTLYDFDTYEMEALIHVGSPIETADQRATVQLALDNFEGPRAGFGDYLSVSVTTSITWLDEDPRCYMGGDPWTRLGQCNPCSDNPALGCCAPVGRGLSTSDARCSPVNDPAGDAQCAAKIGRCKLDRRGCNPTIGGASECGSGNDCYFCGGTYDGVGGVVPGVGGTFVDCPGCEDALNGNGQALPPGYDTFGFSDLDLVAFDRIFVINNLVSAVRTPLTLVWSNTAGRSDFYDNTCDADGAGNDRCQLGESDGGDSGIGTGGSFTTAQTPTFDPNGPPYQFNVSWGPQNRGTEISVQPTNDVGPGPDGIQGCIGDNTSLGYKTPCDQRLGNGSDPGSTGTDDQPVLVDFSVAQDGSDMRPGAIANFKVSDPFADATVVNIVTVVAERDLDILGLTDNLDISFKANNTWCPIIGGGPDCTRHPPCTDRGGDQDGDLICNDDDPDIDGDGVLNTADNCILAANPPTPAMPGWGITRTHTGNQLDDDADGYGNQCDAKFTFGPIVTALDTIQYKTALAGTHLVNASNCGSPAVEPCDKFDLDGVSPVITALDTIRFKQLLNPPPLGVGPAVGPKCAACPLACVGDACP